MKAKSGFEIREFDFPRELVSNQKLFVSLQNSVKNGRLCHAYLFYGPKGVGKKTFSYFFAASLLCTGEKKPCYQCGSCKKVFHAGHPDLFLYDQKRGANALHIETIRQIRQDAYILPNESQYKIYIIPGVEDMSPGAANAFLKVLEEPPSHVIFLLTTDNPELVLETIRSRCVSQELYPLSGDEMKQILSKRFPDKSVSEIESVSELSGGIPGRAIELLGSKEYEEISALSERIIKGLANGNEYEVLAGIFAVDPDKEKLHSLLEKTSYSLRQALFQKTIGSFSASPLVQHLTARQIEKAYLALEKAQEAIDHNENKNLLMHSLSIRLMEAIGIC